jgi:hypothetical protein
MAKKNERYKARERLETVMKILAGEKKLGGQATRAYGMDPITLGLWKKWLKKQVPVVFGGSARDYKKQIRALEQSVSKRRHQLLRREQLIAERQAQIEHRSPGIRRQVCECAHQEEL